MRNGYLDVESRNNHRACGLSALITVDWNQTRGYYAGVRLVAGSSEPIGLLINFGERNLHHYWIFPPQKVIDYLVNRQWLFIVDWPQST